MDTGVTSEFLAALNDEAVAYSSDTIAGKCKSFDHYKYNTGYIQGLKRAEQILHETIAQAMAAQDIDD